jgi:very-short-patch-repair endonuclease
VVKIETKAIEGASVLPPKDYREVYRWFLLSEGNLVIELDGGQHYSERGKAKDSTRDDTLIEMGIKVLRFSDSDVFENIGGVMERIWSCL